MARMRSRDARRHPLLSKVPEVTLAFWIVKLMTTALGEAVSDYLVHNVNPYLAVVGAFVVFGVAMAIQFRTHRYVASAYWFAVTMVAVFGTMAADVLHVEFGVPYIASTVLFAVTLTVVFVLWSRVEGTLSIHSILTRRREAFYWAAVLATFAMGTALGDLAAYTAKLGFLAAGLVFSAVFLVPAIAYRFFGANAIFTFWFAYVVTRPLGASFADWLGKARAAHGLGVGDGPVSGVLALLIAVFVVYFTVTGSDRPKPRRAPHREAEPELSG